MPLTPWAPSGRLLSCGCAPVAAIARDELLPGFHLHTNSVSWLGHQKASAVEGTYGMWRPLHSRPQASLGRVARTP